MNNWTNVNGEYDTYWTETSDPRVLAVIERETEARTPWGDALAPAYAIEYNGNEYVADTIGETYHDDEADEFAVRWTAARGRFREAAGYRYDGLSHYMIAKSDAMLKRWAAIFHATRFDARLYGYDRTEVLLLDTPNYREHVGRPTDDPTASWSDEEFWAGDVAEWAACMNGEVYGIGYATNPERVTAETPVDFEEFDVNIECWGFVGEEYAKESAAAFEAGEPELPAMLDGGVFA